MTGVLCAGLYYCLGKMQSIDLIVKLVKLELLDVIYIGIKINPVSFTLKSCTNEALQQLKLLYERKSINIKNQIPDNTTIIGDFDMITRVFVNLLSNAIKFSGNNKSIVENIFC